MRKVIINSLEQIVSQDMMDFQNVVELSLYDNTVRKLLGDPDSAFWGDSFKVVPVAGMQVKITLGSGYIYDSTEIDSDLAVFKPIVAPSDINVTLTDSDALLQRIDLICVKVARLTAVSEARLIATPGTTYPPSTTSQTVEKKTSDYRDYTYVQGTAGMGTPATPAGYTKIATITVDAGATSITSNKIEDNRLVARVPATYVSVEAAGNLSSVILQNALEELQVDIDTANSNMSNHISSGTAHQALKVTFNPGTDPNFGGSTNVQSALENLSSIVGVGGLAAHLVDPTDAHDASAISVVPFSGIVSTNVQDALSEEFDRFGVQHVKATGAHGPVVTINNTATTDAVRITKSGSQHGLRVDATSADHSAIEINQAGNQDGLNIVKTSGGLGNAIAITNSGLGYDIIGNATNWRVDKNGNALFNDAGFIGSVNVGDNLQVNENTYLGSSGGFVRIASPAPSTYVWDGVHGTLTPTHSYHVVSPNPSGGLDYILGSACVQGTLLIIEATGGTLAIRPTGNINDNFNMTAGRTSLFVYLSTGKWKAVYIN